MPLAVPPPKYGVCARCREIYDTETGGPVMELVGINIEESKHGDICAMCKNFIERSGWSTTSPTR